MTWCEEWVFFFQMIYGKSYSTWIDAKNHFQKIVQYFCIVFDDKLKIFKQSRSKWPLYVTLHEDQQFKDKKCNETYGKKTIVMWDNTALPIFQQICNATYTMLIMQETLQKEQWFCNCVDGWVGQNFGLEL